ncbi:DUF3263 domain-containing protein [Krasilnikovia sp. MM14-A1004]|uniref:DUF3263 domain-containing protein n=1 Tax=Krasilnikovia sp. MM14-A1004 TaxID=3373541 RepID=UPI00399C6141
MQPPADIPDVHETSAVEPQRVPAPRAEAAALAEPEVQAEATAVRAEPVGTFALTEREEQILAFERKWWKHAGSKEQAVRDAFGLSATRYYQLLNGLLDNPAAYEHDPVLIGRLRRLRSARARTRRR